MTFSPHASVLVWPAATLPPASMSADPEPFSRSGGPSLTNLNPAIRTDRGAWKIEYNNVTLVSPARQRTWDALAAHLAGRSGLIAVPVWSFDSAPYAAGDLRSPRIVVPHSDATTFSDGTGYYQRKIVVKMHTLAALSATSVTLRVEDAAADMTGVKFSYEHAAYKTGPATSVVGNLWTVPITPAIRMQIPPGAELNFDLPTCLVRLKSDDAMRRGLDPAGNSVGSVSFEEASDYWSNLAAGLL